MNDNEVVEYLGIAPECNTKEQIRKYIKTYRKLHKKYPRNEMWLSCDIGVYTNSKIIEELNGVVVVEDTKEK